MFTDSTTKVDSEPPNGSNDDITNWKRIFKKMSKKKAKNKQIQARDGK
ncbi:hypothetical protein Tco_1358975, partial [Tanacetum coccineum]